MSIIPAWFAFHESRREVPLPFETIEDKLAIKSRLRKKFNHYSEKVIDLQNRDMEIRRRMRRQLDPLQRELEAIDVELEHTEYKRDLAGTLFTECIIEPNVSLYAIKTEVLVRKLFGQPEIFGRVLSMLPAIDIIDTIRRKPAVLQDERITLQIGRRFSYTRPQSYEVEYLVKGSRILTGLANSVADIYRDVRIDPGSLLSRNYKFNDYTSVCKELAGRYRAALSEIKPKIRADFPIIKTNFYSLIRKTYCDIALRAFWTFFGRKFKFELTYDELASFRMEIKRYPSERYPSTYSIYDCRNMKRFLQVAKLSENDQNVIANMTEPQFGFLNAIWMNLRKVE